MTEIVLNCPRVVPVIGELVAAGMPQHVAVDRERETSSLAGTGNHPLIARNAQWRTPLGNKDVDARGFPLQPAQRSQFPRGQWLPSAYTAFGAPHVQRRGLPVDVIPTQAHKLAGTQPVTVGQQDRGRVTMPPTVLRAASMSFSTSRSVR